MSVEILAAIVGAVFGGFLATISGIYVNQRQLRINREQTRDLFISIIKDDLNNSIPLYDRIKEIGKTQFFVSFEALDEFRYSRKVYDKYTEHVVLIEPHTLRKKIFDYYIKSQALINKLEQYQRAIYSHQDKIREITQHIEATASDTKNIEEKIKKQTEHEKNQETFLFNLIQAEVNNLDNFKIEAKFILQDLK